MSLGRGDATSEPPWSQSSHLRRHGDGLRLITLLLALNLFTLVALLLVRLNRDPQIVEERAQPQPVQVVPGPT